MGGEQDTGGGQGAFAGADGVVGDAGRVYHMGDAEAACLWGVWGKLGGWNGLQGCSDGLGSVLRHSRAAAHGSEWGRAGGSAVVDKHVDDDVAVALRVPGCSTRVKGAGCGELGSVGGLLDRHLGQWGWQSSFIEQQTCSNEHIHTWLRSTVCWAVDNFRASFTALLAVSGVSAGVWVPDEAQVVISEVVAGVATIVGSDVAVER
jgi:hypothetical protein